VREVAEETGLTLSPDALQLLGCWESCYPTSAEECEQAGGIKGHHLVVVYRGRLAGDAGVRPIVQLQAEETDAFVWAPVSQIPGILTGIPEASTLDAWFLRPASTNTSAISTTTTTSTTTGSTTLGKISADSRLQYVKLVLDAKFHLCGIYPNAHQAGITQAYLFLLEISLPRLLKEFAVPKSEL
jgi:ADP-ribose pyrophosphatase YjhB (NUDIX family)